MFINFKNQRFEKHIKENYMQVLIYKLAYIFSHLFRFFNIKPNHITLLSFLLCLISCYYLFNENVIFFLIFWYLSHFLDYCDGTLARLTGEKTKFLLRLDHFVDLIRISITFTFIPIFYSSETIWILSMSFISTFFINQLISMEFDFKKKESLIEKNEIFVKKNYLFKHIYNIIFTFNGHTLFIIGLIFVSENIALYVFIYLIMLNIKNLISPLIYLLKNKRDI